VVLDAFKELPELCKRIQNPTLILHGSADRLVQPAGSYELLRALQSERRELHYLPGVFHEPHLDYESDKFFTIVCRWVEENLPHQKV
jgi:alpha-beta hydrolase superfamily lysophospholipase